MRSLATPCGDIDVAINVNRRTQRCIAAIRSMPFVKPVCFALAGIGLAAIIASRCPTILTHAQFWAEDGWLWYPQAYEMGWHCLFISVATYLQTLSRLVALSSLPLGLSNAPKVFAFSALVIQTAPALFLLSRRMAVALPSLGLRAALAVLLAAVPGMSETYVNVTNAQWQLVLLAFLVLAAASARTTGQRIFDCLVLLVSGLSGPFCVFLTPVAVLWWLRHRERWQLWRFGIVAATAAIQGAVMLTSTLPRNGGHLGWSVERFIQIILIPILGVATLGATRIDENFWTADQGWLTNGSVLPSILAGSIVVGAFALGVIAFIRGPWVLRAFLIFAGAEFAAGLTQGLGTAAAPVWAALPTTIISRYYFHPIIAWLAVVTTLACDRNAFLRGIGLVLMASTILFAIPSDFQLAALWQHSALPASEFHHEAKVFMRSPPGTVAHFPMRPWDDMVLVKR